MRALLREWTSRVTGLFGRGRSDAGLEQELQLHLELAEEDLRRQGLPAEEAARQARLQAGRPTQTIETLRERRGIPPLSTFWLDFKLGARMLRKHWALTLIGGLAMAAAMTIGSAVFNLIQVLQGTTVPFEEGDRVVIVQPVDPETQQQRNPSAQVFEHWRTQMNSLVNVGAFRTVERDLKPNNGPASKASIAEISASGFALARIHPLMGRYLLPEDERSGASPAVVIGYSVWQSTFAADPGIVGQQVQLGGVSHTVVGVMPRGFGFPRNHQYWTPLKAAPLDRVTVFARLAPGATLESAQAQLASVGFGASPPLTESGRPLRPFVRPYVIGLTGDPGGGIMAFLPLVLPLLLLPPCANIGVLMYARIVARQGEFAVRTSLGASRGRIVVQVFVEMLVLAGTAAAVAIALAPTVAETLSYMVSADQPFWMHFGFSYTTILFAGALALVAALIAGGIPALRATQGWQLSGLNTLNRASAPQLGRTWTLIVVAQIALSVAVVPIAAELAWNILRPAILGPGFPVQEFLTARLDLDTASDPAAATARFNALRAEVVRQLQAEPGITAVTASESKPFEERGLYLETDQSRSSQGPQSVAFNQVDSAFLDAFGLHILAGRGFEPRDNDPQGTTVLVNRSFVNHVFPGETPLGRTVRVVGRNASASRYEIVGLVDNQFAYSDQPTMYRPLTQGTTLKELQESAGFVANPEAGAILSVNLAIHMSPTAPPNFAGRLREVTAAVAPGLRVDDVQPLSDSYFFLSLPTYLLGSLPVLVALGVLLFATAGIYTRMSFAVVHRRREIGIRSALGASPRRLIAGIFRSVLIPVAAGVATGALVALLLDFYLSPMLPFGADGGPRLPWILPAAEAFVLLMGVFALFGPVRRTLQVDAVEALREG